MPVCDLNVKEFGWSAAEAWGWDVTRTRSLTSISALTQHHSWTGFKATPGSQRIAKGEVTHSGTTHVAVAKLKPTPGAVLWPLGNTVIIFVLRSGPQFPPLEALLASTCKGRYGG